MEEKKQQQKPQTNYNAVEKTSLNNEPVDEPLKKTGKVVTGKVVKRSTPVKNFANMFLAEDRGDVKNYIIFDWLIPTVKDAFVDGLESLIDMAFYGKVRNGRRKPSSGGSYYNYSSISSDRPRVANIGARSLYSFDDVQFDSRQEAEKVLDVLLEIIEDYGKATVADYYDACGVTGNGYTDRSYGWTDLRQAFVTRSRQGYCISLPRPKDLR